MGGGRGSNDPVSIARYYRECARVGHARYVEPSRVFADLILRGDSDFARTAPLAAAVIRDLCAARKGAAAATAAMTEDEPTDEPTRQQWRRSAPTPATTRAGSNDSTRSTPN
jgi:hypothetical protein